jgi:hypothetical protein
MGHLKWRILDKLRDYKNNMYYFVLWHILNIQSNFFII